MLDPAFVVTSINSPPDNVGEIVVQPDGKLLVAGNFVAFGILGSAKLARFNSDGTIDPDFIPQAYVDAGCCNGYVADIALQPDGKVVAGGSYTPLTIARFWPNIFNALPMISFIPDRVLVGTATEPLTTGPIAFTASDPEGQPVAVTAASSNSAVVPLTGIVLGGSTSSRTVTVNPAAGAAGQSTITLTASDGVRQGARSFVVTVTRVATNAPRSLTVSLASGRIRLAWQPPLQATVTGYVVEA